MRLRFGLLERVLAGLLLALLLLIALHRSPIWDRVPSVAHFLPSRYGTVLDILPGEPNTALATLLLFTLLPLGFQLPRQPLLVPAAVTAVVLGYATYPWGLIHWHELVLAIPVDARPLGVLDWILFALPVLFLLGLPALLQTRAVVAHYRAKGATRLELPAVEKHLALQTLRSAGLALVIVIGLSLLLHVAVARLPTTGVLIANSILVLLIVTALLVAALAVGTGLLSATKKEDEQA